jgi:hypothetical protein
MAQKEDESFASLSSDKTPSSSSSIVLAKNNKDSSPDASTTQSQTSSTENDNNNNGNNNDSAILGIKAHKKSNAVGDPDSDSDDDHDTDDNTDEEWQDLENFLDDEPHQVQVQVELLPDAVVQKASPGGGGGGVKSMARAAAAAARSPKKKSLQTSTTLVDAWLPHIYVPPSHENFKKLLQQQARTVDAFGKTRLDRRTLYAGLLLEWHNRGDRRKFLNPDVAQQLQAALSLATQPQWRQAAPQSSGITLQQGGTLSMQETVAMALVRVIK